jgi:hypothetical protein
MKSAICALVRCLRLGCGQWPEENLNIPSGTVPIIKRVTPDPGTAGGSIEVYGVGYSLVPAENLFHIGDAAVSANSYDLADPAQAGEVEVLSFILPSELLAGDYAVFVSVQGEPSNTDIHLAIEP